MERVKQIKMTREQILEAIARWETIRDAAVFCGERAVAVRMIEKYKAALSKAEEAAGHD